MDSSGSASSVVDQKRLVAAQVYVKEKLNPVIEDLVTDLMVSKPADIIKFMHEWTVQKMGSEGKDEEKLLKNRQQAGESLEGDDGLYSDDESNDVSGHNAVDEQDGPKEVQGEEDKETDGDTKGEKEEECEACTGPLPDGWEEAEDGEGKKYYIDHNTETTTWDDPRRNPENKKTQEPKRRNVYEEPDEERLQKAREWNEQHENRPCTPPKSHQMAKDFKSTNLQGYVQSTSGESKAPRHLNFVGRVGGDEENEQGQKVELTAEERRRRMVAAVEKRANNTGRHKKLGAKISKEKAAELAAKRQRDTLLGKIRAHYAGAGMTEPLGLAAAPLKTLKSYLDRVKKKGERTGQEMLQKEAAEKRERALRNMIR